MLKAQSRALGLPQTVQIPGCADYDRIQSARLNFGSEDLARHCQPRVSSIFGADCSAPSSTRRLQDKTRRSSERRPAGTSSSQGTTDLTWLKFHVPSRLISNFAAGFV